MNAATIKVFATCFWESDESLRNKLSLLNHGSFQWKNIVFTLDKDYDYAVIFTKPNADINHFDKNKTIVFLSEPPKSPHNIRKHGFHTCSMYITFPFWFNSKYVNKLDFSPQKEKLLSAVTSELSWLEGHKRRLKFIRKLDKKISEGFDLFGRKVSGKYFSKVNAYKGELEDKCDGLFEYQYHFASENSFIKDYFTEKIYDPILMETLCFYDGCLNLEDYIDDRAFIRINIKKDNAIDQMIMAMLNGAYRKRLLYIREQKQRLLTDLNPLNIIWSELNGKDTKNYLKL